METTTTNRRQKMPSREQLLALVRFAREHGPGHKWKRALRACWEYSDYQGHAAENDPALLQGVRNQFGPSWLARVSVGDLMSALPRCSGVTDAGACSRHDGHEWPCVTLDRMPATRPTPEPK